MPKTTGASAFTELQNNGIISREDPTILFTNLSQIGAGNFGIVYRVCLFVMSNVVGYRGCYWWSSRNKKAEIWLKTEGFLGGPERYAQRNKIYIVDEA